MDTGYLLFVAIILIGILAISIFTINYDKKHSDISK